MASDALGAAFLAVSLVLAPAVAGKLAENSRGEVSDGRGRPAAGLAGVGMAAGEANSGSPDAAGSGDVGDSRDEWIAIQVQAQLAEEPTLESASEIQVSTIDGVVTLGGSVPSEAARERALQLTRAAPGVSTVIDDLQVRER